MAPSVPLPSVPERAKPVLETLWSSGHAAYLVGGTVRDLLLGKPDDPSEPADLATDARPERLLELFPDGRYENRFGTVRLEGAEVTTFRRDHRYADHRRPSSVTFTDDLVEDLSRRDFTVNAVAWGRRVDSGASGARELEFVDPTGGLDDLRAGLLRAVGDPEARFDEDALRLLRAVRLSAQLGFQIEPATFEAIRRQASLVAHVSRERVGQEVRRLVRSEPPSAGFRTLAAAGLLEPLFPDLARQRGTPQNKLPGHDLWEHTLATLDAAGRMTPGSERLLFAALLHDVGKPEALADGRFVGHDEVGAEIAERVLSRLAVGRSEAEPIVALVRLHMFSYEPGWGDAAVRRFIRKVGVDLVDDLLRLREADNIGSGLPSGAGGLDELRLRVEGELSRHVPLALRDLAVNGDDLQAELGIAPGPALGALLDHLLDSVVADPNRNTREQLLADARAWARASASNGPPARNGAGAAQA